MTFPDDLRRRRLAERHAVVPGRRADDLRGAIEAVVALHSSDPTSVYLSAAARMQSPTVEAITRGLYDERIAVRHHAMRRTLWVMTPDVAQAAHAGFARKIAVAERRRTAVIFGEDATWVADGIERVVDAVRAAGGPVGARAIGALLPDLAARRIVNTGKPYEGTMAPHTRLLLCAAFEGRIARGRSAGSWIGSQYQWLSSDAWHSIDWTEPDEPTGTTDVVRRYLERFGPATLDDVVWWTGGTKTSIRRALERLGAVAVRLDDAQLGYVVPDDASDAPGDGDIGPWVALLPGLDPTAMGWKRRAWYLPTEHATRVVDRNGNIGPTVWVDGQIVGGWVQGPDGAIVHDVEGLSPTHQRLLHHEIERIQAFVGDTRFSVRFPSPNQPALLA